MFIALIHIWFEISQEVLQKWNKNTSSRFNKHFFIVILWHNKLVRLFVTNLHSKSSLIFFVKVFHSLVYHFMYMGKLLVWPW